MADRLAGWWLAGLLACTAALSAWLGLTASFQVSFNGFYFGVAYPDWWAWAWPTLPWVVAAASARLGGPRRRQLTVAAIGLALVVGAHTLISSYLTR